MKRLFTSLLLALLSSGLAAQVRLLAFEGEQLGTAIRISWTIGSGNTCADLEIQHSTDGVNFTEVYIYGGVCGNANFDQSYSFNHTNPKENALNYYRIHTQNGVLSDTLAVRMVKFGESGYVLFPQPASGSASLVLNNPLNEKISVELFDLTGKKAGTPYETTGGRIQLLAPAEGPGIYLLRIVRESGEIVTGRVIFL